MLINDLFHLSYCTNIHPAETWEATFQSLQKFMLPIQSKLAPNEKFGIGLRLSNQASIELNQGNHLEAFKQWLNNHNLYVFTMNGFPYGAFHQQSVKDQVHQPDWSTKERLAYTKRLIDQLAYLLPEGMEGGISTSPISYKPWLQTEESRREMLAVATGQFLNLVDYLNDLYESTGKLIHIDIEPEPDGLIENSAEVIDFFINHLVRQGIPRFVTKISIDEIRNTILRHIQVCYDVCHFALGFEDPETVLEKFEEEGIEIGKIQISAALEANLNQDRAAIKHALEPFNESTYLHQVTYLKENSETIQYPDLTPALEVIDQPTFKTLRTHFHVPLFIEGYGLLQSTQATIVQTLDLLKKNPFTYHLEVETYTWDVLPDAMKVGLEESIVRELEWVLEQLK